MSNQPSSEKNPSDAAFIPNPIGLDVPIQELSQGFKTLLPWLDKSFGRSWLSYRKDENNKDSFYPEVFQGYNLDSLQIHPNDNFKSLSFFKVHDPESADDYSQNEYAKYKSIVSIIFWLDLKKIDNTKTYDFTEELKNDIIKSITNFTFSPGSSISIQKIWSESKKVWEGYTIDTVEGQQLVYPHRGFRFECEFAYIQKCT